VHQASRELEVVPGRPHDRRYRRAARPQLERRFDHEAIAIGATAGPVETLDSDLADLVHRRTVPRKIDRVSLAAPAKSPFS
jgi:hypothetical protein